MTAKFLSFLKPSRPAKPIDPPAEQIERARTLHREGQLAASLALYGEILAAYPNSSEAHYRRANVLKDQGALEAAVAAYDRAIALNPDYAHAFCNRGVVLGQLQKFPEALASYERALGLDPNDALAHCNRGMLLNATGQKDAALASFDSAIACNAGLPFAHFGRAALLQERKQWAASLASYDRAIALQAGDVSAHYNRGTVLTQLEQWAEALVSYDRAIALNDKFVRAHVGRAEALSRLHRFEEALDSYDRAIGLDPDAATHNGRGVVQHKMGRFEAALASYDQAIAASPNDAQACFNKGATLEKLHDFEGALASYRRAIATQPGFADAHLNLALTSLKVGDFVTGWTHYEWRWRVTSGPIFNEERSFSQPLWVAEDAIAGKTILLYGEQGLGDSLQFCRYAPQVAALGARVILEVPRALVSVCSTLKGVTQVIPHGDPLPHFDVRCPLMSLPLLFRTTLETIPSAKRYLDSDPRKVAAWRDRLGAKQKPRIGLTWSGSIGARTFSERSYPLAQLIPYLTDDFEYFCLQTEITEPDRETLAQNPAIRQFEAELMDFRGTAALCECLDLVISVDTSIVHLSGALGKATWALLPFDSDWRWLVDREDSPWYPAVRLFRQRCRGGWTELFARVAQQLRQELTRETSPRNG
jgi:tetratricopeptide (TPR) repeat protein